MKLFFKNLSVFLAGLVIVFGIVGCDNIAGERIEFDDGISSNARLTNLVLSSGELNYAFNPYDWVYEASVPYEVESLAITAMVEHLRATVSIGGVPVDSGSASDAIPLEVGDNIITIVVTAWDGTENIYTITVRRLVNSNAYLASLSMATVPAAETINFRETFNRSTLNYSAIALEDTQFISIAAATEADGASFAVVKAGHGAVANLNNVEIDTGLNRFMITVTAADGTTKQYYTASITRLSGDATNGKVTGFFIDSVTLDPAYNIENYPSWGGGISYSAAATIAIGKMEGDEPAAKLYITTESSTALSTIVINGQSTVVTGTASGDAGVVFPLKAKPSAGSAYASGAFQGFEVDTSYTMVVTVGSADGSTHTSTFTVNISVTSGSSNADLSALRLYWGSHNSQRVIYPGTFTRDATYHNPLTYLGNTFDPNRLNYVAVVYSTETVKIVATPADSTVTYVRFNGSDGTLADGSYAASVMLTKGGVTTVAIEVMPESGKTDQIKTYTLRIKLLNPYEMYWGIYGPMNNKCFARWEALFGSQGVKTVNIPGVISGNLEWKVALSGLQPRNTMTWTQYMDGNRNSGSYDLRVNYNDNHPTDNNLHGFMMQGSVSGLLDGITSKNGTITGGFNLYTPWGDYIGRINANYVVRGGVKMEDPNSYADFEYMGETTRMMYRDDHDGNGVMSPYPFSGSYDWTASWDPRPY
jgi:hypothetical protein